MPWNKYLTAHHSTKRQRPNRKSDSRPQYKMSDTASTSLPLGRLHLALTRAAFTAYGPAKSQSLSAPTTRNPSPDAKRKQFYVNFCSSTSRIATLNQRARPIPAHRGRSRSVPVQTHGWARPDYRDDRSYEALNRDFQSTPPSSEGEEVLMIERGRPRSNTVSVKEDVPELDEEHFLDELI